MKTRSILAGLACCFNLVVYSQEAHIKENISKADANKGIEYFANGTVKSIVNIGKIEFYYKWISSPDTINTLDQISGWDVASLRSFYANYTNETINFEEQIKKCHLIAQSLKKFNNENRSDSLQMARLFKK